MYFLFCESVYLDTTQEHVTNNKFFRKRCPEWITTKAEFFKNAEKRCERTKNECFENVITTIHKNERFEHRETNISQCFFCWCSQTKTKVFLFVCYKNGRVWTDSFTTAKMINNENGLVWTRPKSEHRIISYLVELVIIRYCYYFS